MKSKALVYLFAGLLIVCGAKSYATSSSSSEQSEPKPVLFTSEELEAALKNAREFVAEVDKEDGDTWALFAETAKSAMSKAQWSIALGAMKTLCGPKISRENLRGDCFDRLPDPGAPSGRYFVFDLDSKFERLSVRERIVMMLEKDKWKVAGYFRTKRFTFNQAESKP
ncbi:MAG: hypothetical protein QG602_3059 [Verrucomicrobiota bacterium]|nr:hypothetical protein [Verrucomicrobiota bacterium]